MNKKKSSHNFLLSWPIARPWLILALSLLVVALLVLTKSEKQPQSKPETAWPIAAHTIARQSLNPSAIVYGQVEPLYSTTLRAGTVGYVQSLRAQEGLSFKKGAELAVIDPIDASLTAEERSQSVQRLEAMLEEAKIKYEFDKIILEQQEKLIEIASKSVERQKNLAKRSVASQANIENAQLDLFREIISLQNRKLIVENYPERIKQLTAELNSAKTALKQASLDLSRTRIIAPFDGRVSSRAISIGDRVQVNQALITIYDTNHLEIRAPFPSREIGLLQDIIQSDKTLLAELVEKDLSLKMTLNRIAANIGTNDAGIDVIFSIQQPNAPLRIGQTVKLNVQYPAIENIIAVPFAALFDVSQGYVVFKITSKEEAHRLQSVPIIIKGDYFTQSGEKYILIDSPELQNGDRILSTHLPNARNGLKVAIREAK